VAVSIGTLIRGFAGLAFGVRRQEICRVASVNSSSKHMAHIMNRITALGICIKAVKDGVNLRLSLDLLDSTR